MNKSIGPGATLHSVFGDRNPFSERRQKKKDKDQFGLTRMAGKNWEHLSLDLERHSLASPDGKSSSNNCVSPRNKAGIGFAKNFAKAANPGNPLKTLSPKSNPSPRSTDSPKPTSIQLRQQQQPFSNHSDVTVYVGKNRTPYVQSIEFLNSSPYFEKLIMASQSNPIVVDCEESVFENVMVFLRYKSIEALPPLTDSERFKLRKELEFFGIDIPDELQPKNAQLRHGHFPTADLPDFPSELSDPTKLVIVSRLDDAEGKGKCRCMNAEHPTRWALSFQFRHAFCIGCSQAPANMTPRALVEMFQAAALYFSHPDKVSPKKWSVICDSTCSVKFMTPKPCCVCPCSGTKRKVPMWAVSSYHSHAFCTSCGKCAEGSALICIMLAVRYGGARRSFKARNNKKDLFTENGSQDSINHQSPGHSLSRHSSLNMSPRHSVSSQPSV